jgi:hypothetical protein
MNPFLAAFWGSLGSLVSAAYRYCRAHQKHDVPDWERRKSDASDKPHKQGEHQEQGEERLRAPKREYFTIIALQTWVGAVTAACLADSGKIKVPMFAIGVGLAPEFVLRILTKSTVLTLIGWLQPRLGDVDAGKDRLASELTSVGSRDSEAEQQ